jgi:CSLREA domain-containing protein
MKYSAKPIILAAFVLLLFALASCTPMPVCAPVYNVTKIADTDDGVCSPSDCSLREAVLNANSCPGSHTINLPVGGYALTIDGDDEDLGKTGDLDITGDLRIIGTLPPPSINGGIERAFHIHSGVNVVFEHIWLTGGSAIIGGGLINEGNTV